MRLYLVHRLHGRPLPPGSRQMETFHPLLYNELAASIPPARPPPAAHPGARINAILSQSSVLSEPRLPGDSEETPRPSILSMSIVRPRKYTPSTVYPAINHGSRYTKIQDGM